MCPPANLHQTPAIGPQECSPLIADRMLTDCGPVWQFLCRPQALRIAGLVNAGPGVYVCVGAAVPISVPVLLLWCPCENALRGSVRFCPYSVYCWYVLV